MFKNGKTTNKLTNPTLYLIIGYPGSGKTTYKNQSQKLYCDKNIMSYNYSDSLYEYINSGLSLDQAKILVTLQIESSLVDKPDFYFLEDVSNLDIRNKFCTFAEKQGYKIVLVLISKPKLIIDKKYGEYIEWYFKIRNQNRKSNLKSCFPFDYEQAMIKLKEFDINFDQISNEEKDAYKIVYIPAYSDIYNNQITNSLV